MQERKIHMAHQAMMLHDAHQLLKHNREMTRAHSRIAADLPHIEEADDMGIHIGDVNNIAPSKMGTLGKTLIGAALAAGLIGGGVGLTKFLGPTLPTVFDVETPFAIKDGKAVVGESKITPVK